jgi:hypothetical protein
MPVIDRLEVVDIDHDRSERRPILVSPAPRNAAIKRSPVQQARQLIGFSEHFKRAPPARNLVAGAIILYPAIDSAFDAIPERRASQCFSLGYEIDRSAAHTFDDHGLLFRSGYGDDGASRAAHLLRPE